VIDPGQPLVSRKLHAGLPMVFSIHKSALSQGAIRLSAGYPNCIRGAGWMGGGLLLRTGRASNPREGLGLAVWADRRAAQLNGYPRSSLSQSAESE
jgi:hypothetical protein